MSIMKGRCVSILISLVINSILVTSGNLCSKRVIRGKWVSHGNCGQVPNNNSVKTYLRGRSFTCEGGLHYNGKCYTIPYVSAMQNISRIKAAEMCAERGALLAETHNKTQQRRLQDFALTKLPSGMSHVYLWVGMEYRIATSTVHFRSGESVDISHLHWDSGEPSMEYNYLILEVGDDGDASRGFRNYDDSSLYEGVLCEKDE